MVVVSEDYKKWLLSIISDSYLDFNRYSLVIDFLFTSEFRFTNNLDSNRAFDGSDLRISYCRDKNLPASSYDSINNTYHCSILEMMIGLANRCDTTIMWDDDIGPQAGRWFDVMMESSGLTELDNKHFSQKKAIKIINRIYNRTFDPDGLGGLFYVPGTKQDLRKTEIWYQMHEYLRHL